MNAMLGPDDIAALLRHRPPALLIAAELEVAEDGQRRFATVARDEWLLDAAAQAAGLCVRSDDAALAGRAFVVAAYERVVQASRPGPGVHTLAVRRLRSFLQMHQFTVTIAAGGVQVLAAQVTLAPVEAA